MNNPELSYVQGHYMIGIHVLKICGSTIYKHLKVIYKSSFQKFGKKGNNVSVYKKGLKEVLQNSKPISLQSFSGRVFKRLVYHQTFEFFMDNDFISQNQFGFKPRDSCVNQLL